MRVAAAAAEVTRIRLGLSRVVLEVGGGMVEASTQRPILRWSAVHYQATAQGWEVTVVGATGLRASADPGVRVEGFIPMALSG